MLFKNIMKEKTKTNSIIKPESNKVPNPESESWIKIHVKAQAAVHHILSTIKVETPNVNTFLSIIRLISEARLLLLPTVESCLQTMKSRQD